MLKTLLPLMGVVLAACAMTVPGKSPTSGQAATTPLPVIRVNETRVVPQTRAEITLSFAPVVKQAAPAVVNIYTKKVVERRVSPFRGDPFFERFFQDMFPRGPRQQRKIENSLGSGVILDASGIVVSNHHVIEGADEITVVLQDRREFEGKVIFADEESDLAVVQLVGAGGLPTLTLRDSDTLEVGDLVLAIGNPFGVGQTVTSGIISGLARSAGARARGTGVFIQTDAAINPGNSGGALVDMEGRLVGVNTAILSRSGGSNGIGFAVPANLVARVVNSARSGATELVRPWFGFAGQTVGGEIASALGLATPQGVLIDALHDRSPLAAAGLKRGDVITDLAGTSVNSVQELEFRAATQPLGGSIGIGYLRDGKARSATVQLAAAPEQPARDQRAMARGDALPGLSVVNVNPAVIEQFDLSMASKGVLVVQAAGGARRVGLRPGDFIRAVNGQPVGTTAELVQRLQGRTGQIVLKVERKGRTGDIRYNR
ncbi:MAG: Do family serine endopeptidase [Pseudomonadota bacterium]